MIDETFTKRRTLVLKRGKERVVSNRHPWIFAGAIHSEHGPEQAAFAELADESGSRIATGLYSLHSQIRMRALTFGHEELTAELIESRLTAAIQRRKAVLDTTNTAARLVNSEGDDLSSLVIDRFGDVVVVEITNRGAEQLKPLIVSVLQREVAPRLIYFKNDLPSREIERLSMTEESVGEGEPQTTIQESGLTFHVDPRGGQKTGFFLDQRENRRLARGLAREGRVLNLFSYTGAFGVYAAAGGATAVTNVDVSTPALALAAENHRLNGSEAENVVGDAFEFVRRQRATYDLVVCDPPAFAKSRSEIDRAARGYKDVNLHALKRVAPGGMMLTFSCSGHISLDLFQKIIFAAALDAGRQVTFVRRLGAGPDHPVSLFCPEGEYLKGFLLEVR
ncbi:MAG TPA: class I SAM-dependent rRNA methyltransferase [Thermoanaerobaculia bacterium]